MTNLRENNYRFFIERPNNLKEELFENFLKAEKHQREGSFDRSEKFPISNKRLNYNGDLYATRVFCAVYNDYAEHFGTNDLIEPGDIVVLDKNSKSEIYIKSKTPYDKCVVGVCSNEFAHCIGGKDPNSNYSIPIALAGRVHTKIIGPIKKGDLITTSNTPGVGMKANTYIPGTIVGKALENIEQHDKIKMIRIKVDNF